MSLGRCQAVTWTNTDSLSLGPLETLNEILYKTSLWRKCIYKILSVKGRTSLNGMSEYVDWINNMTLLTTKFYYCPSHYNDVITSAMASQVTSLGIVYSIVYSGSNQRKYHSSASLAFVRGINRWPVNSPHKGPITRKKFHLMTSSWNCLGPLAITLHFPKADTTGTGSTLGVVIAEPIQTTWFGARAILFKSPALVTLQSRTTVPVQLTRHTVAYAFYTNAILGNRMTCFKSWILSTFVKGCHLFE